MKLAPNFSQIGEDEFGDPNWRIPADELYTSQKGVRFLELWLSMGKPSDVDELTLRAREAVDKFKSLQKLS